MLSFLFIGLCHYLSLPFLFSVNLFLTAILHRGLRNCFFFFFFIRSFTFSNFYLDFYFPFHFGLLFPFFLWIFIFPFIFGLLFPFSLWTFIFLFSLDFYSIAVTHLRFFQVFFEVASTFSMFFLDFYFPYLFGLLFPFSIWTFILFRFVLDLF